MCDISSSFRVGSHPGALIDLGNCNGDESAPPEGQLAQPSVALKYSSREPQLYIRGGELYIYTRAGKYTTRHFIKAWSNRIQ